MLSAGRDFALIKDERSIIPHINQTKRTRNTSVSSARGLLLAEVIGNYLSPLRTAFLLWERVNRSLRVLKPPITGGCLIRGGGEGRTRSLSLLRYQPPPPPPPPPTPPHIASYPRGGERTRYTEHRSRLASLLSAWSFFSSLDGLRKKRGYSWSILLVFVHKSTSCGPT